MGKITYLIVSINLAFLTWYAVVFILKKLHIKIIEQNLFWLSHFSVFGWIFFIFLIIVYYKLITNY